ncbi:MAG: hypothetical protein DRP87_07420 [Spirochaetes bacterium]|nr:MAG: hypothetical protein DRP87_07420 [Spirochaetota bacterium]
MICLRLFPLLFFILLAPGMVFVEELSLDRAVELAITRSGEVRIREMESRKAEYALNEAKSKRLPRLEVQGSASLMSNPPEGIKITKGAFGYAPTPQSVAPVAFPDQDYVIIEDAENTYFKLKATLSQPIFTSGKINAGVELASLERDISRGELEAVRLEKARDTREVYYSVLFAENSVRLMQEAEKVLIQITQDRETSFDEGLITREEVLEAKANLAGIVGRKIESKEGLRQSRETLSYLTGSNVKEMELITPFHTELPELNVEKLKEKAITRFPELNILFKRLRQALADRELKKGSSPFHPELFLDLTLDITGGRVPIVGSNWLDTWDANLILSIGTRLKVFDSGESKAKLASADESIRIAQEGIKNLIEGLELKVSSAVESVRTGYYRMKEKEAHKELAEERYRNALLSFQNELITREEERWAKVAEITATIDLLLVQYQYEKALTELYYLTGELY